MGKMIASLALKDEALNIVGAVEARNHPDIGRPLASILNSEKQIEVVVTDNLNTAAEDAEAIIDFTTPTALVSNLAVAKKMKIAIVVGTTGLTDEEHKIIKTASSSIPVLVSANMSVGVNLLFKIAPQIANALGDDYDIEIIEAHHNKKKDSPSGTAKRLAELIADAMGRELDNVAVYGRHGNTGERPKGEIGIHAVRAGDIIGEHTIIYAGEDESIELKHRAHSRQAFALGALRAAKFLTDKSPGLYDMQDVIKEQL
jgi:4-hydroxy-tetrahydrodipicolinate reductase